MLPFSAQKTLFLRLAAIALCSVGSLAAQTTPDVLVLANGDTLHGKFVKEIGGSVTFHSDMIGDVTVPWDKIKELHSSQQFAVIPKGVELQGRKKAASVPTGTVNVEDKSLTITGPNAPPPMPVANAAFIVDKPTVDKLLGRGPSFLQGWNGGVTAGATVVSASTRSTTLTAGLSMVRTVPNVPWLNTRNRTLFNFAASYGTISQSAYLDPGPPPTVVPATVLKTGIIHFDAARNEYISPRVFVLGQVAFDHNQSLDLHLQQIYGGGFGVTAVKSPRQELDFTGTLQYQKQDFSNAPTYNLIGSTFGLAYRLQTRFFLFNQGVSYLPAYNETNAWSFNEVNTLAFPAYKNLSFTVGTLNTYLNNPPTTLPPTVNNSFQFTFGLTYAIKSKFY